MYIVSIDGIAASSHTLWVDALTQKGIFEAFGSINVTIALV